MTVRHLLAVPVVICIVWGVLVIALPNLIGGL